MKTGITTLATCLVVLLLGACSSDQNPIEDQEIIARHGLFAYRAPADSIAEVPGFGVSAGDLTPDWQASFEDEVLAVQPDMLLVAGLELTFSDLFVPLAGPGLSLEMRIPISELEADVAEGYNYYAYYRAAGSQEKRLWGVEVDAHQWNRTFLGLEPDPKDDRTALFSLPINPAAEKVLVVLVKSDEASLVAEESLAITKRSPRKRTPRQQQVAVNTTAGPWAAICNVQTVLLDYCQVDSPDYKLVHLVTHVTQAGLSLSADGLDPIKIRTLKKEQFNGLLAGNGFQRLPLFSDAEVLNVVEFGNKERCYGQSSGCYSRITNELVITEKLYDNQASTPHFEEYTFSLAAHEMSHAWQFTHLPHMTGEPDYKKVFWFAETMATWYGEKYLGTGPSDRFNFHGTRDWSYPLGLDYDSAPDPLIIYQAYAFWDNLGLPDSQTMLSIASEYDFNLNSESNLYKAVGAALYAAMGDEYNLLGYQEDGPEVAAVTGAFVVATFNDIDQDDYSYCDVPGTDFLAGDNWSHPATSAPMSAVCIDFDSLTAGQDPGSSCTRFYIEGPSVADGKTRLMVHGDEHYVDLDDPAYGIGSCNNPTLASKPNEVFVRGDQATTQIVNLDVDRNPANLVDWTLQVNKGLSCNNYPSQETIDSILEVNQQVDPNTGTPCQEREWVCHPDGSCVFKQWMSPEKLCSATLMTCTPDSGCRIVVRDGDLCVCRRIILCPD